MDQNTELEYLKRELELAKSASGQKLLKYDPFTLGFLFTLGAGFASFVLFLVLTLFSLIFGIGLLSLIGF